MVSCWSWWGDVASKGHRGEFIVLRSAIVTIGLLVVGSNIAAAQQWAVKMFEVTDHDFGVVARGGKVEFPFTFTNIYEEDLHVSHVRSSCGCTIPRVTRDTVKTYEKSAIVAAFNTRTFQGQRSATVTVVFDKPYYAEVQLHVRGLIRSDILLQPESINLGTVTSGAPVEKRLRIDYSGRGDWRVLDVLNNSRYLETKLVQRSGDYGRKSYDLFVRLKPDAPQGIIRDELMLRTNDSRGSELPICVEGRVLSEITVSPAPLLLGLVHVGESVTKKLIVRGTKPFRITDINCGDDCFEFELSKASKPLHLVPVTFVAGDKPGDVSAKIRLKTDLKSGYSPEVVAHAQVVLANQ